MKLSFLFLFLILTSTSAGDSLSLSRDSIPWRRISVKAGGFISRVNSNFGFKPQDGGVKVTIDSEDQLKLDEKNRAFRVALKGRIKNKHCLNFDIYHLNREATTLIGLDLPVTYDTIGVGTEVKTTYKLSFTKLTYEYAVYQNKNVEIAVGAGVHFLISDLILTTPEEEYKAFEQLTVPLPVLSTQISFAPRPWWVLCSNLNYLYVSVDAFEGSLIEMCLNSDFRIWKYAGLGVGLSTIRFHGGAGLGERIFADMNVQVDAIFLYATAYF